MAIGSIAKYLKALDKLKPPSENTVRYFRVHSQIGWKPMPSLFREGKEDLRQKEYEILHDIHIHYPDAFLGCNNLFEELVLLQHYGVPTRLLDISTNPLIALYFACADKKSNTGDAEVLVFDIPYNQIVFYDNQEMLEVLDKTIKKQKLKQPYPITCIKARLNNPRIIRQSGAFLFFADNHNNNRNIIKEMQKIEISKSHIKSIIRGLDQIQISSTSVYPELQKYAEKLTQNICYSNLNRKKKINKNK